TRRTTKCALPNEEALGGPRLPLRAKRRGPMGLPLAHRRQVGLPLLETGDAATARPTEEDPVHVWKVRLHRCCFCYCPGRPSPFGLPSFFLGLWWRPEPAPVAASAAAASASAARRGAAGGAQVGRARPGGEIQCGAARRQREAPRR